MEWLRENHPILRYCETLGMTQRAFAEKVHCHEVQISFIVNGQRRCSRDLALKIHFNTGGAIDLKELLEWGEKGER